MPVPKKKVSRVRRDNRRSHHHLAKPKLQKCAHCGEPKLSHRVCRSCGFYGETEVLRMETTK